MQSNCIFDWNAPPSIDVLDLDVYGAFGAFLIRKTDQREALGSKLCSDTTRLWLVASTIFEHSYIIYMVNESSDHGKLLLIC